VTDSASRDLTARVVVSAMWVVGLAVVGKALGLFKDVAVASRFGTSVTMDAFLVAFTIPTIIVHWFRSPVRSGFVPMFTETLERDGEERAWRAAGAFIGDFLVVVALIAVVAMVAAPWLVSAVAPGFGAEHHELTVSLVRIMLVSIVFAAVGGTFSSLLHIHGNFALPGVMTSVNNLILVGAAVFLTGVYGIHGLAYGVVLGSATMMLVQLPAVLRLRRNIRLSIDFRDPMFVGVMRLALPLLIGMAGAKLDDVIDRIFASMMSEGSISGLAYALRLIELPKEILVAAFATVLFPLYSRLAARGLYDELGDRLSDSMRLGFFMLLPVSVAMAMLGEPFVRLVFQRGAFDEESVRYTVSALLLYTPTIWALGLTSIMTAGFVAMKNTRTPVIAGFVRLGFKVGLVFLLVRAFEHSGIALATSISHVFKLGLFLILLPPELMRGRYVRLFKAFGGTVAATAVMALVLYLVIRGIGLLGAPVTLAGRLWSLALMGASAAIAYVGAARLIARSELSDTVRAIGRGARQILRRK
jgi:putative peptidoglycan lipid II flippase